jgi:phage FluMu protein gp41
MDPWIILSLFGLLALAGPVSIRGTIQAHREIHRAAVEQRAWDDARAAKLAAFREAGRNV